MLNAPSNHRQSLKREGQRRGGGLIALAAAAAMVVGATVWFISNGPATPAVPVPQIFHSAAESRPLTPEPAAPSAEVAAEQVAAVLKPEAPPPTAKPVTAPTLAELEQRFLSSRDSATRIELAGDIAGSNDAAAVLSIARLFPLEHHPEVKVALLAGLADIDPDTALETRLSILTAALGAGARDVRTTAVDSLAQLDNPRATALLRRVKTHDPDKAVRETAAALLDAAAQ